MAFKFKQIDAIADFDEAMEVLENEYVPSLIDAFADSPQGQALLQAQSEGEQFLGNWVGNLVIFGYVYLGVTLPSMKAAHVEDILLELFPRKLTLLEPEEATGAIPELIAFWQFLQSEYKHRHSRKILTLLQKIQPEFEAAMYDPQKFGMAKSFMTAGMAAGFDMTTEEGIQAFQQHYNQRLQERGGPPPRFPSLSSIEQLLGTSQDESGAFPIPAGVPPEFVALLSQQMGLGTVPGLEHLPSDPNQLIEAIAHHLIESGDVVLDETHGLEANDELDFSQQLQVDHLQRISAEQDLELSEDAAALLQQQIITETEPGTIVRDFQTLLEAMSDGGLPVSGKLQHLSLKVLGQLNSQLTQPIQIALKRPQQKSYPNLHGLYLLLRSTGITRIVQIGKQSYLQIDPEIFASWQKLNPTEKYFTLLEAWVIRGDPELLGDRPSPLNSGTRVLQSWFQFKCKHQTFANYNEQQSLSYWPGFDNLALLQMFGWAEITSLKPEPGKGWRVKTVKATPLGEAIASVVMSAYVDQGFVWSAERDFTQPWGDLQPYFHPYFSEWENNLVAIAPPEHQLGTYIFKVSLGKIWRRLSISSESTLDALAGLILKSVDFDCDHLDMFSFKDITGRTVEIHNAYNDWHDGQFTGEVTVGDLPLKLGAAMTYLFDFGDNWEFNVLLEDIQPGKPKRNVNRILGSHGKAPEQYPNWDDAY